MTEISSVGITGSSFPSLPPKQNTEEDRELKPADSVSIGSNIETPGKLYFHSSITTHEVEPDRDSANNLSGIGYDENFLGEGDVVPLPKITGPAKEKILVYNGSGDTVRNYTHFSLVMNRERKLPFYSACNLDGKSLVKNIKRTDWKIDETIGADHQLGNEMYEGNYLDKGHLTRRRDVCWGSTSEAKRANSDSFYYTNAAPQHKKLNQGNWALLENWLLERADEQKKRLCVITGPIFRDDDVEFKGEKIPADFWKIVILRRNSDNKVSAAAFMISQKDLLDEIRRNYNLQANMGNEEPDKVNTSQIAVYQVPIKTIERLTSLDFGNLREVDAYALYDEKNTGNISSCQEPIAVFNDSPNDMLSPGGAELLTREGDIVSPPTSRRIINSKEDILI